MWCYISIAPILFLIRRRRRLCRLLQLYFLFWCGGGDGMLVRKGGAGLGSLRGQILPIFPSWEFLTTWWGNDYKRKAAAHVDCWHYHFLLFQSYPKLIPTDVNTDDFGRFETSPRARLHQGHNNLYCITVIPAIKTNHLRLIDRLYNNLWTWYRGTGGYGGGGGGGG